MAFYLREYPGPLVAKYGSVRKLSNVEEKKKEEPKGLVPGEQMGWITAGKWAANVGAMVLRFGGKGTTSPCLTEEIADRTSPTGR